MHCVRRCCWIGVYVLFRVYEGKEKSKKGERRYCQAEKVMNHGCIRPLKMNFVPMKFKNYITGLVGLFFPKGCASCDRNLVENEFFLCTQCLWELPKTNFHLNVDNEIAQNFWGRIPLENATAHYFFQKGGHVQKLLHKLKYKGQKEIGIELGKLIGFDLKGTSFSAVDLVIPVPLHKSKLRKRGYNQSECLAAGISGVLEVPVNVGNLTRTVANPTQTKKHRYERWQNVEGIFSVKDPGFFENKHVLLVDDVITTGATLEACVQALQSEVNVRVSVVTAAMA
jgi:ComF family protein